MADRKKKAFRYVQILERSFFGRIEVIGNSEGLVTLREVEENRPKSGGLGTDGEVNEMDLGHTEAARAYRLLGAALRALGEDPETLGTHDPF